MTSYYHSSNHITTYECDNIPDHRSRCYGCSHSELTWRKSTIKKAAQDVTVSRTANAKCPTLKSSTLLSHSIMSTRIWQARLQES